MSLGEFLGSGGTGPQKMKIFFNFLGSLLCAIFSSPVGCGIEKISDFSTVWFLKRERFKIWKHVLVGLSNAIANTMLVCSPIDPMAKICSWRDSSHVGVRRRAAGGRIDGGAASILLLRILQLQAL